MNIKTWTERLDENYPHPTRCAEIVQVYMQAEIDELRAALKVQPVQEPFCMHWVDRWGCNHYADKKEPHPENATPLYAAPVQPAPLTDAEILSIIKNCPQESTSYVGWRSRQRLVWARAIEAAVRTGGAG